LQRANTYPNADIYPNANANSDAYPDANFQSNADAYAYADPAADTDTLGCDQSSIRWRGKFWRAIQE